MMLQAVFKSSWICFLLFSIGVCAPLRKSPPDADYYSGYRRGGSGTSGSASSSFGSTVGGTFYGSGVGGTFSGSDTGSSAAQDADISQMITDMLSLDPYNSRPLLLAHWRAPEVPLGMVGTRPVNPPFLIVHTDSGYQRARDFRFDSKYTHDTFDHIRVPGTPQHPGSGSKDHQKL